MPQRGHSFRTLNSGGSRHRLRLHLGGLPDLSPFPACPPLSPWYEQRLRGGWHHNQIFGCTLLFHGFTGRTRGIDVLQNIFSGLLSCWYLEVWPIEIPPGYSFLLFPIWGSWERITEWHNICIADFLHVIEHSMKCERVIGWSGLMRVQFKSLPLEEKSDIFHSYIISRLKVWIFSNIRSMQLKQILYSV